MMRSVPMHSMLISGLVLVSLGSASTAHGGEPTAELRANLSELHHWLDGGGRGSRWRNYLQSDQLETEIASSDQANPSRVAAILTKYSANHPGLDKSRFVAVRTALTKWLDQLEANDEIDLSQAALDAKDHFRPLDENLVGSAKQKLIQDMRALDAVLLRGGRQNADGWKVYLRWDEIEDQLSAEDGPAINTLQSIYTTSFRGDANGLELRQFTGVRESLLEYMRAEFFANIENVEQEYQAQLDTLADRLAKYQEDPTDETATEIAFILGWLKNTGQAGDLVQAIRRRHSRPNVTGYISGSFFAAGVDRVESETRRVNEYSGGTNVRGYATIAAKITSRTVSHPNQAAFDILLNGSVKARVHGSQGPVTVCSKSVTHVNAWKRIFFDEYGFHDRPAHARCRTNAYVTGISAPPIIRHFARKPANQAVNRSERSTSRRVQQQVEDQLNEESAGTLADANERYADVIRNPLLRRRAFPQWFSFAGTTSAIHLHLRQANDFQLAAPANQPPLPADHALGVNLHQSAINNVAEAAVAGEKFTHTDIASILEDVTDEVPSELQATEDGETWSITFDTSRPVSVQFQDGTLKITIRGRRFENGDQAINKKMAMSATYAIDRSNNAVVLRRQGDAVAEYISQDAENLVERAIKSKMKARFTALFTEEIDVSEIELPGAWDKIGKLWLAHITSESGWLTLGVDLGQ